MKLIQVLQKAEAFLRDNGCESARLDAQLLLAEVLGCERVSLYVNHEKPIEDNELSRYRSYIRRRANHEPVAYITKKKEFWSLEFELDQHVLIPRPESETLLEQIASLYDSNHRFIFADIGTGCGCLAAAIARTYANAHGIAVDIDNAALAVAKRNFVSLGVSDKLQAVAGHLLEPLTQAVDLIVANLPYIPTEQIESLQRDVRFEPLRALDGGPDGLRLVRELIHQAPGHLNPHGWLLLEVGEVQAQAAAELCSQSGLQKITITRDLAGTERIVGAYKLDAAGN